MRIVTFVTHAALAHTRYIPWTDRAWTPHIAKDLIFHERAVPLYTAFGRLWQPQIWF